MDTKYVTVAEFTRMGILPLGTVRNMIKRGQVPGIFTKPGNKGRFYIEKEAFLKQLEEDTVGRR